MSLHNPAPLSFQPDHAPPPDSPSPQSSSLAPIFPYQHALPAQRVQSNLPHQSYATTHSTLIHSGIPSAEQRTAVSTLKEVPNPTICAWLEGFRSSLRGEQGFHTSHYLSLQQHHALSTLVVCSNELVLSWLDFARSPGQCT